ncbi:MAG: hypothetical protein ACLQVI_07305 [Polyangiaceae bacterium]
MKVTKPADAVLTNVVRALVGFVLRRGYAFDDIVETVHLSCAEWVRATAVSKNLPIEDVAKSVGMTGSQVRKMSPNGSGKRADHAVVTDLYGGVIYTEYCSEAGMPLKISDVEARLLVKNNSVAQRALKRGISARDLAEKMADRGLLKREPEKDGCYFVEKGRPLDDEEVDISKPWAFGGSALNNVIASLDHMAKRTRADGSRDDEEDERAFLEVFERVEAETEGEAETVGQEEVRAPATVSPVGEELERRAAEEVMRVMRALNGDSDRRLDWSSLVRLIAKYGDAELMGEAARLRKRSNS